MDNSENVESCEVPISENYMNDATEGLDDVSMNDATSCDSGGMKRRHIYGLFAHQAGGYENGGFSRRDILASVS
ncbi:unnamed protein product [Trifolium pratense]|uniref:Uncharacterized protein n=1 Tax=Trifolium pratense TaxID=57577 RepID=A0ACB0JDA7_TRIPR|nr:unnamed protein product [Trifolium pratense]